MKRILTIGVILLFIGSISSSTGFNVREQSNTISSNGKTLYVGGSGPDNYTKIQDAIDNASDGDTFFVFDDLSPYKENLIVEESISVVGESNLTTCIDGCGGSSQNTIHVKKSSDVIISDFNILNASGTGFPGAVITIEDSKNCKILRNIIITENEHGIIIVNSSLNTIFGNSISNKDKSYHGILIDSKSALNLIHHNIIFNNSIGIMISINSYFNEIYQNTITDNNIGVAINKCDGIFFHHNTISENSRIGIKAIGSQLIKINDNNINENKIGIYMKNSKYCPINRNTILSNSGKGIHLIQCQLNDIQKNYIMYNGEGILLNSSWFNIIKNNNISKNKLREIKMKITGINWIWKNTIRDCDDIVEIEVINSNFDVFIMNNIINKDRSDLMMGISSFTIAPLNYWKCKGMGKIWPRFRIDLWFWIICFPPRAKPVPDLL